MDTPYGWIFFGNFDLALISLYAFWLFFCGVDLLHPARKTSARATRWKTTMAALPGRTCRCPNPRPFCCRMVVANTKPPMQSVRPAIWPWRAPRNLAAFPSRPRATR